MATREEILALVPNKRRKVVRTYEGDTAEIIREISRTFADGYEDTKQLATIIGGDTVQEKLYNVWALTRAMVRYVADPMGLQDVKRPGRTLHDGFGDCKSYSILIASLLKNMGIPAVFRYASYDRPDYQHVYVVAKDNGKEYVLDACLPEFNTEDKSRILPALDMPTTINSIAGPVEVSSGLLADIRRARQIISANMLELGPIANDLADLALRMENALVTGDADAQRNVVRFLQAKFPKPIGVYGRLYGTVSAIGVIDPATAATAASTAIDVAKQIGDVLSKIGDWLGIDDWFGPGEFDAQVQLRMEGTWIGFYWIFSPAGDGAYEWFRQTYGNNSAWWNDPNFPRDQAEAAIKWTVENDKPQLQAAKDYFANRGVDVYTAVIAALLKWDDPQFYNGLRQYLAGLPRHVELTPEGDLVYYYYAYIAATQANIAKGTVQRAEVQNQINRAVAWYKTVTAVPTPTGGGTPTSPGSGSGNETPTTAAGGSNALLLLGGLGLAIKLFA